MLLKVVSVKNERNVLVQVPIAISDIHWNLKEGDSLEVHYDEDTKELRVIPQKVSARGDSDAACEELPRLTTKRTVV